jgi:hypothetical protein
MKKKFLFGCVVFMAIAWNAFAQSAESDFETKEEFPGELTITKYVGWDTELVIPAAINGKPVTVIGEKVFQKTGLTGITLPEGLKLIRSLAFAENKLTAVSIPSSVTHIGKQAFYNNQLTGVTLGDGVAYIDDYAFAGNKLTSLTIPDTVLEIDGSFGNNPLTSVTIGNGLVFVDQPFYDIPETLTSLTLGANIKADLISLDEKVFYDYICNDRQAGTYTVNRTWSKSRATKREGDFGYIETEYGVVIIRHYGSEDRVRIPDTLNGKPVKALYGSAEPNNNTPFVPVFRRITNVLIPDSITYIGHAAFYGNTLSAIKIPDSVTYIGAGAFTGGYWETARSSSYEQKTNRGSLTSLTLPGKLTYIGTGAFANQKIEGSLVIPDTVTDIGDYAFVFNDLSGVTLGKGVTRLGTEAFASNKMTGVTIPATITAFGKAVFSKNQLTSLTISSGVKIIADGAFSSNQLTGVTIPPGIETIGDSAFSSNQLETIVIPDSVTYLGASAFSGNKLKSFTLGKGITSINANTFADNNLKDVTIPNGITSIGGGAFLNNGMDRTITLPDSVAYIGAMAFAWGGGFNCIKTLVIGSNVRTVSTSFGDNGLALQYDNNGKKKGRYTITGNAFRYSAN